MNTTKAIQRQRSPDDISATYLRLLQCGNPEQADWPAAAELIQAGLATGTVHRSSTTASGEIDSLFGFAPTLHGRLFALQLQEQLHTRSLIGRMKKWIWILIGAVGALIGNGFAGLLTEAMKRGLGW